MIHSVRTIRFATEADKAAVVAVWSASFPEDTDDCRDRFLNMAHLPQECLLAEEAGQVVSMLFMLPVEWKGQRLQYVYAAATLPEKRGRGVFTELLAAAIEYARTGGCVGSFLRPAEPSLENYYARFGYRPWDGYRTETGLSEADDIAVTLLSPEAYAARRAERLPSGSLVWESRFVTYAAACGLALGTPNAVALCDKIGDTLYIRELLGDASPAALAAAVGCARYDCRRFDGAQPFMMFLPLTPQTDDTVPYVGLALD